VDVHVFAPGRVNLIGEHTDHAGGLALPMAIDLGISITGRRTDDGRIRLTSAHEPEPADVPTHPDADDVTATAPPWARYVAAVAHEVGPPRGLTGTVRSTLPAGAGLSSSAALEVAVALALGAPGGPLAVAQLAQRAEHRATGVPCGLMDQWASAAGRAGHALLMDFTTLTAEAVPLPEGAAVVVVHSGEVRRLEGSPYAERQAACQRAAALVGPLRDAAPGDLRSIADPTVRRRARHVVTENARVRAFAEALRSGDLAGAGALMVESHRSLREDFEVSTPTLDALVDRLLGMPGVHGARLTGAGFGGCVVALTEPGAVDDGWTVRASDGARAYAPGESPERSAASAP